MSDSEKIRDMKVLISRFVESLAACDVECFVAAVVDGELLISSMTKLDSKFSSKRDAMAAAIGCGNPVEERIVGVSSDGVDVRIRPFNHGGKPS